MIYRITWPKKPGEAKPIPSLLHTWNGFIVDVTSPMEWAMDMAIADVLAHLNARRVRWEVSADAHGTFTHNPNEAWFLW